MRKWIKLFEAQTKTKDKTGIEIDIDVAPDSQGDLTVPTDAKNQSVAVPGKAAGKEKTRSSIRVTDMPPEAGEHFANLGQMDLEDEISDEEAARIAGFDDVEHVDTTARPEPVTPENLPSVIRQDMMAHGDSEFDPAEFNPEWHQVKHLPGYMQTAIRAIGRMVFRPFTDTPIEDIQVLATLSNPEKDVRKMMSWISRNGIRDDDAELKFEEAMPGYEADVKIYSTEDAQFMLVKDFAGYYIYGWPGGRGVHLDAAPEAPRLEAKFFDAEALKESYAQFMNETASTFGLAVDALTMIAWEETSVEPYEIAQNALEEIGDAPIGDDVIEKALNRIAFGANAMGSRDEAEQIAREALKHINP